MFRIFLHWLHELGKSWIWPDIERESYLQKGLSHGKALVFFPLVKEHNFDQFDWINFNFCTELCFLHVLQAHTALYRGALPTSTSVEELISAFICANCATGFRTAPTAGMRVHTAEVSLHNSMLLCFFILPHPSLAVSLRFVLIAIFSSFLGKRSVWWEQHWSILCLHTCQETGPCFCSVLVSAG